MLPIIAVATHLYRKRSRQMYREVRTQNAVVTGHLAENISGVRVVQAFAREDTNLQNFDAVNRENLRRLLKATAFSSGFGPVIIFISTVATVAVIWFGGQRVLAGVMTVGSLYAFLAYVGRFFEPINDLSSKYNSMQAPWPGASGSSSCWTPAGGAGPPGAQALPPIERRRRLRGRRLRVRPGPPGPAGHLLHAEPGGVVALVGHTGAGKSSIINILLRFYDIKSGAITIDGHDIRDVDHGEPRRARWASSCRTPSSSPEHVRDNIRYGRLDATDEEVVGAAKAVNLHDFIESLPFGYDTEVQERGQHPLPGASASCSPSPGPSSPTRAS